MSTLIQYYEAQREKRVEKIEALRLALNEAGAAPPWTPSRLHLYVNARYEVDDGLDSLSGQGLDEIELYLTTELESLSAGAVAIVI